MGYAEIFILKEMLEKADIPFEFKEAIPEKKRLKGYQIGYPVLPPNKRCVCSVVEHGFSYGNNMDLLEIMGLLTDSERECDSVCGYLKAKTVFDRIEKHYKEVLKCEKN